MTDSINARNKRSDAKKIFDLLCYAENCKKKLTKCFADRSDTHYANDVSESALYIVPCRENDNTSGKLVIGINELYDLMNESRKTYRAEDQCDCELKKEYISESGMKIKRYCIRKTAEEQKAFEELATRRTWEIVSKYVK